MATFATPDTIDLAYGPLPAQRYDHFKHPIRDVGGNPVLILRHGGGWTTRDKRLVSQDGDELGLLARHLLRERVSQSDQHFDVISIGSRQEAWNTPISVAGYSYSEAQTSPAYYPQSFQDIPLAVMRIRNNWRSLGIDPNRVFLGGTSAGAVMGMWSQLNPPLPGNGMASETGSGVGRYPSSGPYDSRVAGLVLIEPVFDFRLDGGVESVAPGQWRALVGVKVDGTSGAFESTVSTALREAVSAFAYVERGDTRYWVPTFVSYATDVFGGSGATYTTASNTITKVGGFTGYTYLSGDKVRIKHSTGTFLRDIASRPNDDSITISTSISASNLTNLSFEVLYGKPYGTLTRDPHNDQDIQKFVALCQSKSLPIAAKQYATYGRADAEAAYNFMAHTANSGARAEGRSQLVNF